MGPKAETASLPNTQWTTRASRLVTPELLDHLPPDDSAAQRSRAELRRLNRIMGHARILARELRANPFTKRWCDIGSGDGTLLLRVADRLGWRDVHLTLVDQQPLVSQESKSKFHAFGWQVSVVPQDVFAALRGLIEQHAVTANLFLHHFKDDELRELLRLIARRTKLFVAVEPRRSTVALLASKSIRAIGCGPVTRHDAVASVRAGFAGRELTALWPEQSRWRIAERPAGLFSHLFVACRI